MNSLFGTSRRNFISYLLVFLIATVQFVRWEHKASTSAAHSWALEIVGPVQHSLSSLKSSITNTFDDYLLLVDVKKENARLGARVQELESQLRSMNEVSLENRRLQESLDYPQPEQYQKVFARIIAWDSFSEFRIIRINSGSSSGIKLKDAVVTPKGLVGYIYSVSPGFSEVLLVNDVNNRIDILNTRTRSRGVVEGDTDSLLRIKYTELKDEYAEGDLVVTAGLSFLPKGIIVGEVSHIEKSEWLSKTQIYIKPSVEFGSLEDVSVLIKKVEESIEGETP